MEQLDLPLVVVGLYPGMQVVLAAVGRTGYDPGAYRVGRRDDHGRDRRSQFDHVLSGPGAHGDDQVDVLGATQACRNGFAHGGPQGGVEVAGLPPRIGHELDVVAAGMRGQVKPGLSHIGYLRHVVDMQPSELLQCARDRVERARILFVLAATHITDAPFPAGGMGGGGRRGEIRATPELRAATGEGWMPPRWATRGQEAGRAGRVFRGEGSWAMNGDDGEIVGLFGIGGEFA